MRERVVETYLRERVEALGGRAIKLQKLPGWPDRLVLFDDGGWRDTPFVKFVELKRPKGGHLSRVQKAVHLELFKLGHFVHTISTKQEVDGWLRQNGFED
jgi:hypothetical protein